ncbi:DUF4180 domain-containing protein [Christensenella sp. MSJ-20]|uniref:DUF4180 domain-containing protein n=1 Tax=Christensenella sp. MSJ-20 TaxID=2841518 RepID=UPI000D799B80|nr:MAG: DUF4180 domain-containing protein [Bacillota bacterium]QWT55969.1 DUF4180 domain-containing protein [Christensenella sp. MSJ-20]
MIIQKIVYRDREIALIEGCDPIADGQSALDLMAAVRYETGCNRMALPKEAFSEDFFRLSTGLLGEILQKYQNYGMKLAVYGDYSGYTSKPLRDFIYESNEGRDFFFLSTQKEALERLAQAK